MEKEKKIKFFFGSTYSLIICLFLWVLFSKFSISDITSYEFIKNNRNNIIEIKNSNYLLISIIFFIFTIIWVLLLGFGTPICLLGGFIFGKWVGTILVLLSLSIGATLLYVFANFFLKELVEEKFYKKFSSLSEKFKKNEFTFFLIYRFVGGIPFFISNILPTIFNVKVKNFLFGSFLGMAPQIFIYVSLGSGLEKIIKDNLQPPTLFELFISPDIYIPIIGFIILLIISIIIKNIFYKN